jgi:hypothetical protein
MSTPQPVKTPMISAATVGAGTAGTLASLVIYFLSLKGIVLPAGIGAGIASLFAAIGSHLPKIFQLRA